MARVVCVCVSRFQFGFTSSDLTVYFVFISQSTVLGSGGIMYNGGNIMSGPQDSLVDLLMPSQTEDLDKVCIYVVHAHAVLYSILRLCV